MATVQAPAPAVTPATATNTNMSNALTAARLSDQAATAALYARQPDRKSEVETHATSIRDSKATGDSTGTGGSGFGLASAGAAASLAHARSRPLEVWKPEKQLAAEQAAFHAGDVSHVPEPPQPPQSSTEGFKAAASALRDSRQAAGDAATITTPTGVSADDTAGMVRSGSGNVRIATTPRQDGAMLAAAGAFSGTRARRADSAPPKPWLGEDTPFALSAADASHRAWSESEKPLEDLDPGLEASRIHHIANVNAQMYTSTPPVSIEVEEQNKRNTLRAAAISMAQDLYAATSRDTDDSAGAAAVSAARTGHQRAISQRTPSQQPDRTSLRQAISLQEAAQKLAAEKLARMQTDTDAYQSYYGTTQPSRTTSRLPGRRKRTVSDADASTLDMERSMEIRNQMSSLQTKLHELDEKKQKDRELLMQAARRNVDAAIHDMDMKMYAEKGRAPPSLQREWEEKARERARLESEAQSRAAEAAAATGAGGDRIHIGGDQHMDRADVEAIARARLQPTLDEIDDRAEKKRALEVEQQLDAEQRRRWEATERQREADLRAEEKRQKAAEKQENKGDKLRLWRRLSKQTSPKEEPDEAAQSAETTGSARHVDGHDTSGSGSSTGGEEGLHPEQVRSQEIRRPETPDGSYENTRDSRIKSWFKDKMGHHHHHHRNAEGEPEVGESNNVNLVSASTQGRNTSISQSHPVTGNDLALMQSQTQTQSRGGASDDLPNDKSSSRPRTPTGDNEGGKKSRLRKSFMKIVSPKSQNKNKDVRTSSPSRERAERADLDDADGNANATFSSDPRRQELRLHAAEQGLAPPPAVSEEGARTSTTSLRGRSRFSEDL